MGTNLDKFCAIMDIICLDWSYMGDVLISSAGDNERSLQAAISVTRDMYVSHFDIILHLQAEGKPWMLGAKPYRLLVSNHGDSFLLRIEKATRHLIVALYVGVNQFFVSVNSWI